MTRPQKAYKLFKYVAQTAVIIFGLIMTALAAVLVAAMFFTWISNTYGGTGVFWSVVICISLAVGGVVGYLRYEVYLEEEQRIMNRLKEP